jgi:hypothetical protein
VPMAAPRVGRDGDGYSATGSDVGWGVPDWGDASAYAWLLGASRDCFAWEWLRRSDAYRRDWVEEFGRFGLLEAADTALPGFVARPVWSASACSSVLRCRVGGAGDLFDLGSVAGVTCLVLSGVEHWLVSDGLRSLRVDCVSGSLGGGPVPVRWYLDGVAECLPALLALQRLIVVSRTGRLGGGLFRREGKAARWVMALRVHDAVCAGASQLTIASVLFGVTGPRWRVVSSSERLRVQRLVRSARGLARAPLSFWLS